MLVELLAKRLLTGVVEAGDEELKGAFGLVVGVSVGFSWQ